MFNIKNILIALFLFILTTTLIYSQESYIIPDIGSPGMNVHVEFIAPIDNINYFGKDGFYLNNEDSPVRITTIDNTGMIEISPLVVSWDGRLISAHIFVSPGTEPISSRIDNGIKVELSVLVNNRSVNKYNFYIVKPQELGDISAINEYTLGEGKLGFRSPRGAMVVDSLVLASNKVYNVSTSDCDPVLGGNQGYLPIVIISEGRIVGNGSSIDLSANLKDAGPGGGGGGSGSKRPMSGSGFTTGGYSCSGTYGLGSYINGKSLNGVEPGNSLCDQGGGGGTGHPFGKSGVEGSRINDNPPGQYGAGSAGGEAVQLTYGGGGGGNGTVGEKGEGGSNSNGGNITGNDLIIPINGGSGGGAGNVWFNNTGGSGGGGGGSISINSFTEIDNIKIVSNGGNATNGVGDMQSGGGGGSGGTSIVGSKLNSFDIDFELLGGEKGLKGGSKSNNGGNGGSGRLRIDGNISLNSINHNPDNITKSKLQTTDTTRYVGKEFFIFGTKNSNEKLNLYLKPKNQEWEYYDSVTVNDLNWNKKIKLPIIKADTFYFIAVNKSENLDTSKYNYSPQFTLSQSSANIFIINSVNSEIELCRNEDLILSTKNEYSSGAKYKWEGPNDFTSDTISPTIEDFSPIDTGKYVVVIDEFGKCYKEIIHVKLIDNPKPEIKTIPNDVNCFQDKAILYIEGNYSDVTWSTDEKSDKIEVIEEGTYKVEVVDSNGCKGEDEIVVKFLEDTTNSIIGQDYICEGDTITLSSKNEFEYYIWSNDETERSIEVTESGMYILTVYTEKGCDLNDTINVEPIGLNPDLFSISKGKNCTTKETFLHPNISDYDSIMWSDSSESDTLFVDEEGEYWVEVKIGDCILYDTVSVDPIQDFDIEIVMLDTANFCELDSVTLLAKTNGEIDSYKWNTGDTDSLIKVGKSGTYSITAYDIYGCELEDKFELTIPKEIPTELDPSGEQTICEGDSFRIEMKLPSSRYSYEWSTGDTTYYTYATEEGEYKVYVTDKYTGCIDSNSIYIIVNDFLVPEISGSSFCEGDSTELTLNYSDESYNFYWSTGDSTNSISATNGDVYWVRVWTDNCEGYDTIVVEEYPKPEFEFIGDSVICENLTTELTTDKKFESYQWSTGETTDTLKNVGVGEYTLTVTDSNGCSTTKPIEVKAEPANLSFENVVYEFGKMDLIDLRDTTITVSNNSEKTIEFDYNGVKYVLDPNDEPIELKYKVDTDDVGRYKDTISISMNRPCNKDYKIFINASVYAYVTISSAHIHTHIGANIEVPVYLESDVELKPKDLNFTLDINKDFYFTEEPYYYELKNQIITPQKTEVVLLPGTVLLSEYLETQIKYPEVEFENNYILVEKEPGLITVDSICIYDLRQVEVHSPTSLSVYPNPSDDIININIETGESGTFKLKLISSEGREIYNDSWNQNSKDHQSKINTSEISAGLYQVRVQSPTGIYTKEIIIVK